MKDQVDEVTGIVRGREDDGCNENDTRFRIDSTCSKREMTVTRKSSAAWEFRRQNETEKEKKRESLGQGCDVRASGGRGSGMSFTDYLLLYLTDFPQSDGMNFKLTLTQ